MRTDSEELAQDLIAYPETRILGESLMGDLYTVSQETSIACDHYRVVVAIKMTPTLASRGIYACVDSGRASDMYDALNDLLQRDPTHWVTSKIFEPIAAFTKGAKRSTILIQGWDAPRWLGLLRARWTSVGTSKCLRKQSPDSKPAKNGQSTGPMPSDIFAHAASENRRFCFSPSGLNSARVLFRAGGGARRQLLNSKKNPARGGVSKI